MSTGSLAVLGRRQRLKAQKLDSYKEDYGTKYLILLRFHNDEGPKPFQ